MDDKTKEKCTRQTENADNAPPLLANSREEQTSKLSNFVFFFQNFNLAKLTSTTGNKLKCRARTSERQTLTRALVDSAVLLAADLFDLLLVETPASGVVDKLVVAQTLFGTKFSSVRSSFSHHKEQKLLKTGSKTEGARGSHTPPSARHMYISVCTSTNYSVDSGGCTL